MDKRTTGIVATIASVLLCGCPGLFLCVFGGITALGGGEMSLNNSTQALGPTVGYVLLCLSLIFMAIPIVVGVVTLRKRKNVVAPVVPPVSGPMPPTTPDDDGSAPSVTRDDEEPLPPAS